MEYKFDIKHAEKYGLQEAIILNNIIFWIRQNKANGDNFYDGFYWTYNSINAWSKLFPFMTLKKVRRALEWLVDQDVLKRGNYNRNRSDRTFWYALVDEAMLQINVCKKPVKKKQPICPTGQMHLPSGANGSALKGKCILTDKNPDIKPDNKLKAQAPPAPDSAFKELLKKVNALSFNPYACINKLKKQKKWCVEIPQEVVVGVCERFLIEKAKNQIKSDWPWFVRVFTAESKKHFASMNEKEGKAYKKERPVPLASLIPPNLKDQLQKDGDYG